MKNKNNIDKNIFHDLNLSTISLKMESKFQNILEQHRFIKNLHPKKIILFKIGAFYEMIGEDAIEMSKVLNIKIMNKSKIGNEPMCGFSIISFDEYVKKILDNGFSIAVVEESEKTSKGKSRISDRYVSNIITPSLSNLYSEYNFSSKSSYVCSVIFTKTNAIMCFFDISTGELFTEYIKLKKYDFFAKLEMYDVNELIISNDNPVNIVNLKENINIYEFTEYSEEEIENQIKEELSDKLDTKAIHFLKEMTFNEKNLFINIVKYTLKHSSSLLIKISSFERRYLTSSFKISYQTLINLSIISNIKNDKNTLFNILDETITPMGRRKLLQNIIRPSCDITVAKTRTDIIEKLIKEKDLRNFILNQLSGIDDIERISFRFINNKISKDDVIKFARSVFGIKSLFDKINEYEFLHKLKFNLANDINYLFRLTAIMFNDFEKNNEKGIEFYINQDVDDQLQHLINKRDEMNSKINDILEKIKEESGVKKLLLNTNAVYKYSFTVQNNNVEKFIQLPYISILSQNDKEVIFSHSEILKIYEDIEKNEARIDIKINKLITEYCYSISKMSNFIHKISEFVSNVDFLYSLTDIAIKYNYSKPEFVDEEIIEIEDGYHPIYSVKKNVNVVKNNFHCNQSTERTLILTGANMSGKTMYLKQIGMICFMARIGCYVPCKSMKMCNIDGIFSRIGGRDDLYNNKSTFFIEMEEMAEMLNYSSNKSICLIDELGRGTSFRDGYEIAKKMILYLNNNKKSFTVCSTHIHELTSIEASFNEIKNYYFDAKINQNGNIFYEHKIKKGIFDSSFAFFVAKMSGVPDEVFD